MSRSRKKLRANVKKPQTTVISYKYSEITESWLAVISSRGNFLDMLEGETIEELHEETEKLIQLLNLEVKAEYVVDRSETPEEKQQEIVQFFTTKMV